MAFDLDTDCTPEGRHVFKQNYATHMHSEHQSKITMFLKHFEWYSLE